jgi:hypothetical protein
MGGLLTRLIGITEPIKVYAIVVFVRYSSTPLHQPVVYLAMPMGSITQLHFVSLLRAKLCYS